MLGQVIVGPVSDAPEFSPAEGEEELDIGCCLGIEGEFFLIVISHSGLLGLKAELHEPVPAEILPVCEPLEICIRLAEELHFHLLELTGSESEVAGSDLVAERLTDLADSEGNFLSGSPLNVLEVNEDALRGLGSEIDGRCAALRNALEGLEHQVELTDVCPVEFAAAGAGNGELVDEAHHLVAGPSVDASVQSHLVLCRVVFDQLVGTESLAAGFAVHERIGKAGKVSAGHPCLGVHQDRAVNAYVLRALLYKFLPPGLLDVVLEFDAQIAVVPCVGQSAVNLGTGVDESSGITQCHDLIHCLFH